MSNSIETEHLSAVTVFYHFVKNFKNLIKLSILQVSETENTIFKLSQITLTLSLRKTMNKRKSEVIFDTGTEQSSLIFTYTVTYAQFFLFFMFFMPFPECTLHGFRLRQCHQEEDILCMVKE